MEQKIKVFDMATLTRTDAIILEEFIYRGDKLAVISVNGNYYLALQIDREHGLCFNSRYRRINAIFEDPKSHHFICRMCTPENNYFVPALDSAGIDYDCSTLDEAKQLIKYYLL